MSVIGAPRARLEGPQKVTGTARYAFERQLPQQLYGWVVQSAVGRGTITAIDAAAVRQQPGVVEVLTHENAISLADAGDGELLVLQSAAVSYRGQPVAVVLAETLETAREAAAQLRVSYDADQADINLRVDHPQLYSPEQANAGSQTDSRSGDVDAALSAADVRVDATYTTPALFNNPMEPHATVAEWTAGRLEVVDSVQGTSADRDTLATLFSLDPGQVRVRAEHVGGGFGSKGTPRPVSVLAAMAAKVTGRPVKMTYTRQMMFAIAGYRSPTISHFRLGAGGDGRLTAISQQVYVQTSPIEEFVEQAGEPTRHMYAAPNRLVTHRVAPLNVPTPRWMRAPGECPGMYALESAMDELAVAAGVDPVELRVRNEPEVDPASGQPFSSRRLIECLRRGAELFGWAGRDPRPGVRREGRWLVGTGVAASTYPALAAPAGARAKALPGGRFEVGVNATDIGTGARTVMHQIAADALAVEPERVSVHIADSDLPTAPVAGGSMGTASWGWAVDKACRTLGDKLAAGAPVPDDGLEVEVNTKDDVADLGDYARFSYGAQFVVAKVDLDSGEIAVPRMVGVFSAGRIMNSRTARSQFLGGMTMGLSMALHEDGELDPVYGDYANHDFATYHVATAADVGEIHVEWLDDRDEHFTPLGGKGIGEIGIVGTAAAVTSAVWHATGIRVRDLPVQPDKLLADLPARF